MTCTPPSQEALTIKTASDLAKLEAMSPEERDIGEIASLLREAALIAERIKAGTYEPDRIDSASWRAADALLVMRRYVERRWPGENSPGIHERTGRRAKLESVRIKPTPPRRRANRQRRTDANSGHGAA